VSTLDIIPPISIAEIRFNPSNLVPKKINEPTKSLEIWTTLDRFLL